MANSYPPTVSSSFLLLVNPRVGHAAPRPAKAGFGTNGKVLDVASKGEESRGKADVKLWYVLSHMGRDLTEQLSSLICI